MLSREINPQALIGPSIALLNAILSPDFLNFLPDKYSHVGYLIAALISVFFPKLLKPKQYEDITIPPSFRNISTRLEG